MLVVYYEWVKKTKAKMICQDRHNKKRVLNEWPLLMKLMELAFGISYDPLKWDFNIASKMNIISLRNALLTWTLSVTLHIRPIVLLQVWSYDF